MWFNRSHSLPPKCFLATIQGTQVRTGVDTFAEVTAIRLSVWEKIRPRPEIQSSKLKLHGVGGSSVSHGFAAIPIMLQAGFRLVTVPAYIMNDDAMPTGVDLLLGVDTQLQLSMEFDSMNHVIFCQDLRADIFLYDAATLARRLQCRPLTVFASCSGPSFIYCQLVNLGFHIDKWYASEIDPTCILIAEKLIPAHVYVNLGNIFSCAPKLDLHVVHVDLHISTAPCQGWSRLATNPLGFDDSRAKAFIESHTIHERLAFTNHDIQYLVEKYAIIPIYLLTSIARKRCGMVSIRSLSIQIPMVVHLAAHACFSLILSVHPISFLDHDMAIPTDS